MTFAFSLQSLCRATLKGALCVGLGGAASLPALGQDQPNIVFIMADDLGWGDLSTGLTNQGNGNDFHQTPAIAQLAEQGVAFTNAYASPTCAATRAAILSGAYAPRDTNGVYQVASLNPARQGDSLLVGPDQGGDGDGSDKLPEVTVTHAQTLQAAGYTTANVGKFHVASNANQIINQHGFDENFGGAESGSPGSYHAANERFGTSVDATLDPFAGNYTQDYVDQFIKPYANGTDTAAIDALVGTAKHVTDATTDAAVNFINRNANEPFFLQYSTFAVHTPIDEGQARADLLDKYEGLPPGTENDNASFGALTEGLDQSVARLIDYLQTTEDPRNPGQTLDQNTVVVFYSDNGGQLPQSSNGGLSGQKGDLGEGGIRVPLIAWSGNDALVDGGTVNDTAVVPTDFYTTFAGLADAPLPTGQALDGENLSGILADRSAVLERENIFFHLPGYTNSGRQTPQSATRSGDYKLLYNYEDQTFELYNLTQDIAETVNLAEDEAYAEVLADLGVDLIEWLVEVDAPLATVREASIEILIDGLAYADGEITVYKNQQVTILAGQEVPFVLNGVFAVPEPATAALIAAVGGLGLMRRRRWANR